jgi:hypothetical protein
VGINKIVRNESRGKRYLIGKAVSICGANHSYNGNPAC